MPVRIQRQRMKGWRMPEGAVYVGRPSRWGNPFRVGEPDVMRRPRTVAGAVAAFQATTRRYMDDWSWNEVEAWLAPLRDRDLVCWCSLDQPCHADVLLELANIGNGGLLG